ncbi:MAG: carbamoyl-phosphate synthase large subunit [Erythrobacter sp.]
MLLALTAQGKSRASELFEAGKPKPLGRRLAEVRRSDWIATLALLVSVGSCSVDAWSQTPAPIAQWPGAEIAEGVAFQGDGSVTLDSSAQTGLPVISFWRPVLHDEGTRYPVAGRMDCRIAASQGPFVDTDFDPAARHAAVAKERRAEGYIDGETLASGTETIKQLDVIGRRNAPRSFYVLSYIMARDGERLIDIRRNCTFVFGAAASKPDVLPYVNRYTKFTFAFAPPSAEQDS